MKIFRKEYRKSMKLFFSTVYDHIIIVPMCQNKAGIYYEQDICTEYDLSIDDENLGIEIISALNKFEIKEKELTQSVKSDWSAYKHSKVKTLKLFEENYTFIDVCGLNEKNLVLDIKCEIKKAPFIISSNVSFNAEKVEIGKIVKELYNYSIKIAGVI
ncbi:MAG: hypothetical protein FWC36_02500 [Spirochaetes bacterium]|nr:hypothetical protein [Spirochaetota bacterium]